VNRDSPRPRSHPGGPSCPMPASPRLRTGDAGARKKTFRVNEHEPQGSERVRSPRGGNLAWTLDRNAGRRRRTGARVGRFRSAEVDRTHLARYDRDGYQAHTETSGLARTDRRRRSDAPTAKHLERQRCAGQRRVLLYRGTVRLMPRAKASSGSHPEGCGLGDSGSPGPRAHGCRYDGRVSGSWTCLSKPGVWSRLWPRG